MSTAVAKKMSSETLSQWMESEATRSKLTSALRGAMGKALQADLDAGAFASQLLITFQDPKIQECTLKSQFEAIFVCAQFAFVPALKHVAIIPRNKKVRGENGAETWIKEATVMPQWQGYKALMERSSLVASVKAEIVFSHERYDYDSDTGRFVHYMDPFDPKRSVAKDLSNIAGGYLVVNYRDGRKDHHFVLPTKILKNRDCSESFCAHEANPSKPPSPWHTWPDEMVMKTIYRDAFVRGKVNIDFIFQARMRELINADDEFIENTLESNTPAPALLEESTESIPIHRRESRASALASRLTPAPVVDVEPEPVPVEADPVEEEAPPAEQFSDLKIALHNSLTETDVDGLIARVVDYLDEINDANVRAATALCIARKEEIRKKGAKK